MSFTGFLVSFMMRTDINLAMVAMARSRRDDDTNSTKDIPNYCYIPLSENETNTQETAVSIDTLSEAWRGVNGADLMAALGAFGTDFYDRSILRPKHRAYYRSGSPVIKIGPKGALGSREIRPIHSAPSLGRV